MLDLAITGGTVIDGSGAPRRTADVGIQGGRIVCVGTLEDAAHRVIAADGRIVAPGFIDIHTHYDAQVFWDPHLSPSLMHGVTSVVAGNCGFTIAPMRPDACDYLTKMLARVEGMPLEALEAGVPWGWQTTGEYLSRLDGQVGPNIGFMVGHSAIRRIVMGEDATRRTSTPDELEAMRALLRESLSAGGLGFSSSWGQAHFDAAGDPVPSRWADEDELVSLAAVCGDFEGTSLEFVPDQINGFEPAVEAMVHMSVAAHRPLNWNLVRINAADREKTFAKLDAGTRAAQGGGKVVALTMPVMPVPRFSFLGAFALDAIPGWGKAMTLPPAEKLALLRDPVERRHLEELAIGSDPRLSDWPRRVIVETFSPETKQYEGRVVSDIAAEEAKRPFDALVDIVVADELRTVFSPIAAEDTRADWDARAALWRDARVLLGGSDAGAHLDFLSTFNLQTWFLDRVVRTEAVIPLEEAVYRFTAEPAALYGLRDRGTLTEGACADVVVFDEASVASGPVHTRFDLPAGAARLYADAIGIDHVIVNGQPVMQHNEPTGALPGRVLRSGVDTATPQLGA